MIPTNSLPLPSPPAILPTLPNRYSYFLKKKKNYTQWFMHTPILICHHPLDISVLKSSLNFILQHHSSLRMNVTFSDNELIQSIRPADNFSEAYTFYSYKKSCRISFKTYVDTVLQENKKYITFPNNLLKFLIFYNEEDKTTVLVSLCHHILADGYSFKIIADEITETYNKILKNKYISFNKKSTSYEKFCTHSINFFKTHLHEEVAYWKKMPWSEIKKVPFDYKNDLLSNIEGTSTSSTASIKISSVHEFMRYFKGEGSYGLVKVLLIAIAKAYRSFFNSDTLLLNYVYNGRFSSDDEIYLDRTVGWFSEGTPLFIPTQGELQERLNNVEMQIDKLYYDNSSYGYLKYIFHTLDEKVFCWPEISFNYIPPSLNASHYTSFLTPTQEFFPPFTPLPDTQRVYLLNAKAYFTQGNFVLSWSYSHSLFKKSKIDMFAHACLDMFKKTLHQFNMMC